MIPLPTLNIVNEHETVLFPDVEALAYATLSTNPVKPSVSSNPLTPTCYKKPKDHSGNNPDNPKLKQNGHNNSSKSGSRNSSKSPGRSRQPSKSPSRGQQMKKTKQLQRSTSGFNTQERINAMAFSSTRHPSGQRVKSIERPFHRPLTPNTRQFYSDKVFKDSPTPDRFKDVFSSGRCIRCYCSRHIGTDCPKFTLPCPCICYHCRFLYHESDQCPYKNGSPIPRSRSRSTSRSRPSSTDRSTVKKD